MGLADTLRVTEPAIEKRVTWAELFFDLVFVFAITQMSAMLHAAHSPGGLLRAVVLFVPLWWAWVGTTVHANTHDVDNPVDRLGILVAGLCGLGMALAVPGAYGDRAVLFGGGYLALRIVLAVLYFRGRRFIVSPFSVALLVSGPLLLAGAYTPGTARIVLWALAGAVDLATPALLRRRLAVIAFHPEHLPERFGLFVIIALGESIVAIGANASSHPLTAARLTAVALAFTLACALWWVYFVFAASAVRHAIATAVVRTDIIRQVLAYAHLCLVMAIVAVAVGLAEAVSQPEHRMSPGTLALLYGGCVLYLATFGYTRWRMFRVVSWTRLGGAAVCLLAAPAAALLPTLGALAVVAIAVAGVNVVEAVVVRRHTRMAAARAS
jgi:low temperature requirement protein LtrA